MLKKWLLGGALILVCLGAVAFLVRRHSLSDLKAECERTRAAGNSDGIFEWISAVGPVDEKLQEDFSTWQEKMERPRLAAFWRQQNAWQPWIMGQDPAPPASLLELISKHEADLKELSRFLSYDSLRIGATGWAARDKAAGKSPLEARVASFIVSKWAAYSLGYSAMLSPNPAQLR